MVPLGNSELVSPLLVPLEALVVAAAAALVEVVLTATGVVDDVGVTLTEVDEELDDEELEVVTGFSIATIGATLVDAAVEVEGTELVERIEVVVAEATSSPTRIYFPSAIPFSTSSQETSNPFNS